MKVLGIDQATSCGFAVFDGGKPIKCGAWDLSIITPSQATKTKPAESPAKRLSMLFHLLNVTIRTNDIELIAYEKVTGGTKVGGAAGNLSRHLEAMILLVCDQRGIPFVNYAAGTIKKHATGDGSWNTKKEHMIAAAIKRWPGWFAQYGKESDISDDMVDAMWIADLAGLKHDPDWV